MANSESGESALTRVANWFAPAREYFRDTFGELRKVHWPTRAEVRNLTIIVLAVTLSMAILLGLFDFIFQEVMAGVLKVQPDPIAVAVLVVVALAILVMVLFAGRERH